MSDHAHVSHLPTVVSLGSSVVGFVSQLSGEMLIQVGGVIVGGAGVLWSIFAHFSDKRRMERENQALTLKLAKLEGEGSQKDHRITFLESRVPALPVVPKPEGPTP